MLKYLYLTCYIAAAALPGMASAQQVKSIGLQGIIHGRSVHGKSIKSFDKFWANTRGGEILCTVTHPNTGVTDQVRVRWDFDRDVTTIRAGGSFKVTMRIDVPRRSPKRHQRRTQWFMIGMGGYAFNGNLVTKNYPTAFKNWGHIIGGGSGRVYDRKHPGIFAPIGSKTYTGKVTESIVRGRKGVYCSMAFSLSGFYDVVYLYRTGTAGRKASIGRPSTTSGNRLETEAFPKNRRRTYNAKYMSIHNDTNQTITVYFRYRNKTSGSWKWYPGPTSWLTMTIGPNQSRRLSHNGRNIIASRVRYWAKGSAGGSWTRYRNEDYWLARNTYTATTRRGLTMRLH